jgi:hypothetical protein
MRASSNDQEGMAHLPSPVQKKKNW